MRVPNLSIRALMVVIAFCAISAAVVREEARPISGFIVNGSLPMLSALLLGTLLKASSDRARRFLAGFQLFGWIAIVGLSAAYFYLPSFARWYFSLGYLQPAALTGALPPGCALIHSASQGLTSVDPITAWDCCISSTPFP